MSTILDSRCFSIITVCVNRWEFLRRSLPTWQAIPNVARIVVATYDFDPVPDWLSGVTLLSIDAPQFHRTRALNAAAKYTLEADKPSHLLFIDSDVLIKDPLMFHRPLDRTPPPDYLLDSDYAIAQLKRHLSEAHDPENGDRGKRGTHLVRSELFAEIHGFDQRLQGWGFDDLNLYARYRMASSNHALFDRTLLDHQPHDDQLRASHNPQGATLDNQLVVNMKVHNENFDARGESWRHELGYPNVSARHLPRRGGAIPTQTLASNLVQVIDSRSQGQGRRRDEKPPQNEALHRSSAKIILEHLFQYVTPRSVLEVGCGSDAWLEVLQELGVTDLCGVAGDQLDPATLALQPSLISWQDLQRGFKLGRRFDLVISLEVAQHIGPDAAGTFVESLVTHGDLVLFAASIPFQSGQRQANERFQNYWAELFVRQGYLACDVVRPALWANSKVHGYLRQNTLLFAHPRALQALPQLAEQARIVRPLAVVHPEVYLTRMQQMTRTQEEVQQLMTALAQGGTFEVTPLPGGQMKIHRL